jgi:putative transposase
VFRLRPTARQHVALAACVDAHRELYNAALQERRDAWSRASKIRISYGDQSAQLTEMRAARPDQAVWSFSSQQATLRRLNKAFAGFFRRLKAAKAGVKPGYPRFKGAGRFDSVQWPKNGDGARWLPEAKRVYLHGIGQVKVDVHREVAGRVKTIQIKRAKAEEAGRAWIEVDPRHTSDGCERCGHTARENRVTQAEFACQRCGHTAPADEHAARNILRAGLVHHAQAA